MNRSLNRQLTHCSSTTSSSRTAVVRASRTRRRSRRLRLPSRRRRTRSSSRVSGYVRYRIPPARGQYTGCRRLRLLSGRSARQQQRPPLLPWHSSKCASRPCSRYVAHPLHCSCTPFSLSLSLSYIATSRVLAAAGAVTRADARPGSRCARRQEQRGRRAQGGGRRIENDEYGSSRSGRRWRSAGSTRGAEPTGTVSVKAHLPYPSCCSVRESRRMRRARVSV